MTFNRYYKKARKRVKAKKEFYQHFTAYIIVIGFLFVLNMLTSPFNWWFYWPMLGWGIGIAFHYTDVFGLPFFRVLSDEWEEKEMQKELNKIERKEGVQLIESGYEEDEMDLNREEKLDLNIDRHLEVKEGRKNYAASEFV